MARTSSSTVADATPTKIFSSSNDGGNDGLPAREVELHCAAASAAPLLVHVNGVHAAGEFATIRPGLSQKFAAFSRGGGNIESVTVDGDGGTATYDFSVTLS